jgi:hypothetical protein
MELRNDFDLLHNVRIKFWKVCRRNPIFKVQAISNLMTEYFRKKSFLTLNRKA